MRFVQVQPAQQLRIGHDLGQRRHPFSLGTRDRQPQPAVEQVQMVPAQERRQPQTSRLVAVGLETQEHDVEPLLARQQREQPGPIARLAAAVATAEKLSGSAPKAVKAKAKAKPKPAPAQPAAPVTTTTPTTTPAPAPARTTTDGAQEFGFEH